MERNVWEVTGVGRQGTWHLSNLNVGWVVGSCVTTLPV